MRDYEDDEYYDERGNSDRRYRSEDGYGRRYRSNDGFDDEEFGGGYQRQGQRRRDWSDDFDDRDGGRTRRPEPRPRRSEPQGGGYRQSYERDYDVRSESARRRRSSTDPDDDYGDYRDMKPAQSFRKRHPIVMNLIYICLAAVVAGWMLMLFLDYWTFHGQERTVPEVKGQVYSAAAANISLAGLRPVLSDSVFDAYARPGTVVEQIPIAGARVKKGGSVYMTIVAFSPKLVTVPDFMNVSARQARSMFEGLGIKEVREVPVVSEFSGLVLGAKFNGAALKAGMRIPVSAVVTIEVGSGYSHEDTDDDYEADTTEDMTSPEGEADESVTEQFFD